MASRPNFMTIDNGYASIVVNDLESGIAREITTTLLNQGRYVRIDDGRQYPQLCKGAARTGNTLVYENDEQLARDCNARLLTCAGYERAKAKCEFKLPWE